MNPTADPQGLTVWCFSVLARGVGGSRGELIVCDPLQVQSCCFSLSQRLAGCPCRPASCVFTPSALRVFTSRPGVTSAGARAPLCWAFFRWQPKQLDLCGFTNQKLGNPVSRHWPLLMENFNAELGRLARPCQAQPETLSCRGVCVRFSPPPSLLPPPPLLPLVGHAVVQYGARSWFYTILLNPPQR